MFSKNIFGFIFEWFFFALFHIGIGYYGVYSIALIISGAELFFILIRLNQLLICLIGAIFMWKNEGRLLR